MENQKNSGLSFASTPNSLLKVGSLYKSKIQLRFCGQHDFLTSQEIFMVLSADKYEFDVGSYDVLVGDKKMLLHITNRDAIAFLSEIVI